MTKHVGNSLGWSVPGIYYDMAIYRGSSILSYKDCCYFIGRLIVLSLNRTMLEMHSDFLRLSAFCSCADIFLLLDSMNIPVGSSIRITLHYNPDYDCHHIRLAQNVLGCIHAWCNSLTRWCPSVHTVCPVPQVGGGSHRMVSDHVFGNSGCHGIIVWMFMLWRKQKKKRCHSCVCWA